MHEVEEETRQRRRKATAEFFTPIELVNEILDKLPSECWASGKTFCDPAAGNGNFLVEVLRRKVEVHHHDPLQAISTIYAVELMADNVQELKARLFQQIVGYLGKDREKLTTALNILKRNIVCHNTLTYDYSFK